MTWQAFFDFLKSAWPSIVGAIRLVMVGKVAQELQSGAAAKRELQRLENASHAASRVDLLSDNDVVRELKKRGLYRDAETPAGGKLN